MNRPLSDPQRHVLVFLALNPAWHTLDRLRRLRIIDPADRNAFAPLISWDLVVYSEGANALHISAAGIVIAEERYRVSQPVRAPRV